jgi:hypothetical protein
MFRAFSCSSSGATTSAEAASGLQSELGDSSAVARGRASRPDHEQQQYFYLFGLLFNMFLKISME